MDKGPTKLFLSYARGDDEAFVHNLYSGLANAGFEVWFDRVSMPSRQLTFLQEVRDAVARCERVVLVIGPRARTSDYVTQEWRFGLELGKAINPVVRLNSENQDGFDLIPEEMKLLHAEDFRDDGAFAAHLGNLLRQLTEPVALPGRLIGVPMLPTHYRAQPELLESLRKEVLADLRQPIVITGTAARVGVQGMGGIGKSVLMAALGRDLETRRAFPDGVVWVPLGQQPNRMELQRFVVAPLGGIASFNDERAGKEEIRRALEPRAVLLILDDVWSFEDVKALDAIGPRCKLLFSTRDAGLVRAVTGREFELKLLSDNEALALLAVAARSPVGSLPGVANQVVAECGRLPLALALCGAMAAGGTPWSDLLIALREHELEFVSTEHAEETHHANLWRAMEVSVRVLPQEQQQRFAQLAAFADKGSVPEAAVMTLWIHSGGIDERHARQALLSLKDRALLQVDQYQDQSEGNFVRVAVHDLLSDLATRLARVFFGSLSVVHRDVLAAYHAKCTNGWYTGPADGYFFQNLRTHLVQAGQAEELVRLVLDIEWLERKSNSAPTSANSLSGDRLDIHDLMEDFAAAISAAPESGERNFIDYFHRIVRTRFPAWTGAPHRLYAQIYPFLRSAPASVAERAGAWLEKYFSRTSGSGPWFRQITPVTATFEKDDLTIAVGGEPLEFLAFSDDESMLVGTVGTSVRGWSLRTGDEVFSYSFDSPAALFRCRSHSKDWILVLRSGRIYRITVPGDPEELPGPKIQLGTADIAPGTSLLAIGDSFGQLGMWDFAEGRWTAQRRGSRTPITAVCFERSGDRLFVARETGICNYFDPKTLQQLSPTPLTMRVSIAASASPFCGWYLGGLDGSVKRWSVSEDDAVEFPETGQSPVRSLMRSGDTLLAEDMAGEIRLWTASTEQFRGRAATIDDAVRLLAVSPDRVAMFTRSHSVLVTSLARLLGPTVRHSLSVCTPPSWSGDCVHALGGTRTGEVVFVSSVDDPPDTLTRYAPFRGPASGQSSQDLWAGSVGSRVVVVNSESRKVITSAAASGTIDVVAFDGAGDLLMAGYRLGSGVVWEARSGGELGRFHMHDGGVTSLRFTSNASLLSSGGADGEVALWKLRLSPATTDRGIVYVQGRALPRLEASELQRKSFAKRASPVMAMDLAIENDVLAVASPDRVALWSFPQLEEIVELPRADSPLVQLAISPDGTRLAGLSTNARCTLWDLSSHKKLCDIQGFPPASGCCWRPDGGAIAVTSGNELMIFKLEALPAGDPVVVARRAHGGKSLRLSCPYHRLRKAWRVRPSSLGKQAACPECQKTVRLAVEVLEPLSLDGGIDGN
jgi:WD40 repeat protein